MVPAGKRKGERRHERELWEGTENKRKGGRHGLIRCSGEVAAGPEELRRPVPRGLRGDEPSGYSPARDRARRRVAGAGDGWIEEGIRSCTRWLGFDPEEGGGWSEVGEDLDRDGGIGWI